MAFFAHYSLHPVLKQPLGTYRLVELQQGASFFDFYEFYDGADSLGSAGYNNYVSKKRALHLGLVNHTVEGDEEFVFIRSSPTEKGPRESVRLEGKRRFDRGLFILDLAHMPTGCGVWVSSISRGKHVNFTNPCDSHLLSAGVACVLVDG